MPVYILSLSVSDFFLDMEHTTSNSKPRRSLSISSHQDDDNDPLVPQRFRRGSSTNSMLRLDREEILDREHIVNAYEAEEERLVNVLGRQMEAMRSDTANLHNALEGEAEALVLRLQRQLQTLRAQLAAQSDPSSDPSSSKQLQPLSESTSALTLSSSPSSPGLNTFLGRNDPMNPSTEQVSEALKRENESLRSKLADAERGFIRVTRQNEAYRDELISLRNRLNISTYDLAPSPLMPSSPSFRTRTFSSSSNTSSPASSYPFFRRTSSSALSVPLGKPQ
ncbi:Protein of unknown function DUF2046 [Phaffia rhodozyma]|uniref:Uncharacterized protein n=1 Tax=Phaffia rhodozyma TaxID=264483 RepID=A0A0F7SMW4_PHARH|nr:Protein of unknown function DUF2046 [Phaffia rhodozyma]